MSVVESLARLGGVATRATLIAASDRVRVDRALEVGDIVVLARGRYALPEVDEGVTTRARTLVDCLRGLTFGEAMAVADSALRHGFSARLLCGLAASARGPGSAQMRRVASFASGDKANPFESGLHAIAVQVPGLHVRPQASVCGCGRC